MKQLNPTNKPYIFVHDDPSRDLIISNEDIPDYRSDYFVIKNDEKFPIFDYGLLLENAKQVHVMESAIRHIVEHLSTKNVKLYLHSFRKNLSKGPFYDKKNQIVGSCKKWEIVKDNKNNNKISLKKFFFILIRKIIIKRLGI